MPVQRVKRIVVTKNASSTPPSLRRSQRRLQKSRQVVEKSSLSLSILSNPELAPERSTPTGESSAAAPKSETSPLYRTAKNPRLSSLLHLPDYPNNVEEASIILSIARAGKEERATRQLALRLTLHQNIKHVNGLTLRGCDKEQEEIGIGSLQRDLSAATQDICEAEQDLGLVRSLVRRKGFPLEFDAERRMPDRHSHPVTDNHDTNPKSHSITPSPVSSDFRWEDSEDLS